ncbi:MAG TPA: glycosyltransferase [Gammaproteobacteria bacterium]|nr:glycosyltransferase [Gammaproteobacteria bacterium]
MTTRKNILILMHNYATQFIDIANQYVKLFDQEKYKVTVGYLSGKPDEEARARTQSEEIIFLNCSKSDIRALKINAIKKLVLLCRKENFYMVISHRYKPIYVMLWVAQFCQIPVSIFVLHAMKTMNFLNRKLLIAALARKNMYFAGVSNAVRDDLRKHLWRIPKERIITLYNCIDTMQSEKNLMLRTQARKKLNIPENALVMGTIGRLAPEKDQKNIIYAFARTKQQFFHAKLLIIGDGPLEKNLKALTEKLNLQNDVIFTGFIPEAQRYLKAFDIFILASTKEAFGRVLLEAMIAKVPVIGTRINGIPEVIGNAGLIVEARDANQLALGMIQIAKQNSDWGEKGYERVKTTFSTDKFNEDFWASFDFPRTPRKALGVR